MKTIFLKKTYSDGPETFYAIPESKIENLEVWSTYDQFGQIIGHENAGDYHFDNSYCDLLIVDCKKAISEKFGIDVEKITIVNMGGSDFIIEPGDGEEHGFNESQVNKFIEEFRKENESLTMCKGFSYWDGHNWKTVITEIDNSDAEWEIVSDEKLIADLTKAIEEKEFESEGFGEKIYEGNGYKVIDNYCQGSWDMYRLIPADEFEMAKEGRM